MASPALAGTAGVPNTTTQQDRLQRAGMLTIKADAASIHLTPELSRLRAKPGEFSALLNGKEAPSKPDLTHPEGLAAGRMAEGLGHGIAGETLLHTELEDLSLLPRRGRWPGPDGLGHRWTAWWSGLTPTGLPPPGTGQTSLRFESNNVQGEDVDG